MNKLLRVLMILVAIGWGGASAQAAVASAALAELTPTEQQDFGQAVLALEDPRTLRRDLADADATLQQLTRAHPRFAPAYRERARFMLRTASRPRDSQDANYLAADALITRALEIDPGDADAYTLRGSLYLYTRRLDAAEEALNKARALGSRNARLYEARGDLAAIQERFPAAEAEYRQALAAPDLDATTRDMVTVGLIEAAVHAARFEDAATLLRQRIHDTPTVENYTRYAQFQSCKLNDQEAALGTVRQALALRNTSTARQNLTNILFARWAQLVLSGHPKEAQALLNEAHDGGDQYPPMIVSPKYCPVMYDVMAALKKTQPEVDYPRRTGEPTYYWGNAFPKLLSGTPPAEDPEALRREAVFAHVQPDPADTPAGRNAAVFLAWDVVERDHDAITILLNYRYDGALGEAYIGATPMNHGEKSYAFSEVPDGAAVGTGLAQVLVTPTHDSPVRFCTDALRVYFYIHNTFHEEILPYRHCWQKAGGHVEPLVSPPKPQHQLFHDGAGH